MSDTTNDDVFQAGNGAPANFNDGNIEVIVNNTNKGREATLTNEILGSFINRMATKHSVRTFSAYADGEKLSPSDVSGAATEVRKLELVAKDARGRRTEQLKYIFRCV